MKRNANRIKYIMKICTGYQTQCHQFHMENAFSKHLRLNDVELHGKRNMVIAY